MFSIDKCNMLFMATNYVLVQVYLRGMYECTPEFACGRTMIIPAGSSSSNASQILKFLRMANFTTFER